MGLQIDGTRTVSYSELSTFQTCEYRHHLSYNVGLRKQNTEDLSSAAIGLIVHACMSAALQWFHDNDYREDYTEILYVVLSAAKSWADEHRPEPSVYIDDEGYILEDVEGVEAFYEAVDAAAAIAFRTLVHLDVPNKWRTVVLNGQPLIEYRLEHPIIDDVMFVGYVDWVAVSLENSITYVVDWKTRERLQDDEKEVIGAEDFNVQLSLYQRVLWELGIQARGTIIYQIANSLPRMPEELKPGKNGEKKGMSRAKIRSDWPTYKAALETAGYDPNDYLDMKEALDEVVWWRPLYYVRGLQELTSRWLLAQMWARRIRDKMDLPLKAETVMCKFCPFAQICIAQNKGYDVDYLIETRYTIASGIDKGQTPRKGVI